MKKPCFLFTAFTVFFLLIVSSIKASETGDAKFHNITKTNTLIASQKVSKKDSVQDFKISATEPGLAAGLYYWGRRHINPDKPYTAEIFLTNLGSVPVTIQSASGWDPNFICDLNQFTNIILKPGTKMTFQVGYNPLTIGIHSLTINFVTNIPGVVASSQLDGIGISGRLRTYDVNFDSTVVGSAVVNRRQLKIECMQWEFADSVIITDLQETSGLINPDLKSFSSDGFRYDKQIMGLPRTLHPGESIAVDICEFSAPHYGDFSATLTTVSDAEYEVSSNWIGVGKLDFVPSKSLLATGGGVGEVSLGSEGLIECTIINTGNEAFFIDSIALDPDPQFTIVQPKNPKAGFPLQYAPVTIQIRYKPNAVGTTRIKLHIYSSELGKEMSVDVVGSTGTINSMPSNSVSDKNESIMSIYPNPLGAAVGTVQFTIPRKAMTELSLYNSIGTRVAVIMDGLADAGDYSMTIPIDGLSSGTYILRMTSGLYKIEQQLVIVK